MLHIHLNGGFYAPPHSEWNINALMLCYLSWPEDYHTILTLLSVFFGLLKWPAFLREHFVSAALMCTFHISGVTLNVSVHKEQKLSSQAGETGW